MYDSPAQLRHRAAVAEDKATRLRRQRAPRGVRVPTIAEREAFFNFHLTAINATSDALQAGRHAQAMAHYAMACRAAEIQVEFKRALWKAREVARRDMYGELEVAA